jgi:hypothetical protein
MTQLMSNCLTNSLTSPRLRPWHYEYFTFRPMASHHYPQTVVLFRTRHLEASYSVTVTRRAFTGYFRHFILVVTGIQLSPVTSYCIQNIYICCLTSNSGLGIHSLRVLTNPIRLPLGLQEIQAPCILRLE